MEPSKPISQFSIEDTVIGFFAVRKTSVREFTRGQFVSLEIGDHSGRIPAVWWEPDHFALTELVVGMVVKISGTVGEYNDRLQININRLRLAREGEYELEDIMPHSQQSLEKRRGRIMALSEKIENSYVKALVCSFFDDTEFLDKYLMAAAGKLWHHAYLGGLAEHSANVAELALEMAGRYSYLDKDVLLFGGLFHDAGKIAQYSTDTVIDYTDEGRLVGHICLADQWICERAASIEAFPESLLIRLRHVILSHHGQLEFASPIVPQTPEAFILYYCDEIDSKMGALDRIRSRQDGAGWSDFVKLLSRHIYFGEKVEG